MATDINHPLFARFFNRLSGVMEKEVGRFRDELLAGLRGSVVEVGAGNGMNFRHYPASVEQVVAVEPEPYLRARAEVTARQAPVPVTVRPGTADELGLPDESFDAAVVCLVLCSVPDQLAALSELRRVLKPGGQLRFLEHVRSVSQRKARLQAVADRSGVWPRLAGGCHCSRDTIGAIEAAGFRVEHERSVDFGPAWNITNPHLVGSALQ